MLLVLIDRFSKWTELEPLRSATAESLKKAFRERIITRYWVPKIVITDNGVQFASNIFKSFLAEMGTKQQFTAPYTPQENPTERANRTVMIAQFAGQNQRNWDKKWPEIMQAVNTSVSESTGYTPSFITQGRELRLTSSLYDRETAGTGRPTETSDEKANELREIFEIVRRNLEKASQDQARHYKLRRRQWTPTVGDVVWAKEHHLSKAAEGFAAKLAPRYDGPNQVTGFASPVTQISTKKERTIHVSELKHQQMENTSERLQQADTTDAKQHRKSNNKTTKSKDIFKDTQRLLRKKKSKDISKDSQRIIRKKSKDISKDYHRILRKESKDISKDSQRIQRKESKDISKVS